MLHRHIAVVVALGTSAPALAAATATASVSDQVRLDIVQPVPGNILNYSLNRSFSDAMPGAPYYDPNLGVLVTPPSVGDATAEVTDATIKAATQSNFGVPPLTSFTLLQAHAKAGELHVTAAFDDVHTPIAENSYLTATATYTDKITIGANFQGNGVFDGKVYVDGFTQVSGGGAVIANIDFTFFDGDPNMVGTNALGSFFARDTNYGTSFLQWSGPGHQFNTFYGHDNDVSVPFTVGQEVWLVARASCTVSTLTVAVGQSIDNACDLGHSVYWGGISGVFDANGVRDPGATVLSDSGFNYLQRSPNAPPVGNVPEPAAWALLIAGFGLTGATLRRRRAVAA